MSDFNAGELLGSLLAGLTIGWGVGWAVWRLFKPHPLIGGAGCAVAAYLAHTLGAGRGVAEPSFSSIAIAVCILIFSSLTIMRLRWEKPHE